MKKIDKIILVACVVFVFFILGSRKHSAESSCMKFNSERVRKLINSSKTYLAAAKQDTDPLFALLHIQEARMKGEVAKEFITNSEAKVYLDMDLDAYIHNLHDIQEDIERSARRVFPQNLSGKH